MEYNELEHHGILGQKWGIRRFQNSDGSLTGAGRKRITSARNEEARNSHKLSDDELDARISRLQKEKQLQDLTYQTNDQVIARRDVNNALRQAGKTLITGAALGAGAYALSQMLSGEKVTASGMAKATAKKLKN